MSLSFVFWLLMFLWLIFGGLERWGPPGPYWGWGSWFFGFILFGILGWQVFGQPIK